MAEALENLYPGVRLGIGPAIENGFYYDIDLEDRILSSEDLPKIEKKMKELASQKVSFDRKDISKANTIQYFKDKGDKYKLELLEELEDRNITFYTQGNFTDLCRGPHIPSSGKIKAIKLLNINVLIGEVTKIVSNLHIYGISFPKQKELTAYMEMFRER